MAGFLFVRRQGTDANEFGMRKGKTDNQQFLSLAPLTFYLLPEGEFRCQEKDSKVMDGKNVRNILRYG